jgi:hypothetical protein
MRKKTKRVYMKKKTHRDYDISVKVMSFEGLDDDISVSSIDSEIWASNVRISQHKERW